MPPSKSSQTNSKNVTLITYPPLNEWTRRVMTLIVCTGAFLFLHQLPVSIVVACAAQLQILLLHWISWDLLDGQPVQRLLSGQKTKCHIKWFNTNIAIKCWYLSYWLCNDSATDVNRWRYLCLLEISSGLGLQPTGTSRRLSSRLSTVTELMWITWKLGAMPPLCFSLDKDQQVRHVSTSAQEESKQYCRNTSRTQIFKGWCYSHLSGREWMQGV